MRRRLSQAVLVLLVVLGCLLVAQGVWNFTGADGGDELVVHAVGLVAFVAGGLLLVLALMIARGLRSRDIDRRERG